MSDPVTISTSSAFWPAVAGMVASICGVAISYMASKKIDIVKKDVNSNASADRAEIKELRTHVQALLDDKAEKKQTAALLAQAVVEKTEARGD